MAFRIGTGSVYPRPRGGTEDDGASFRVWRGLSPPTRGNHPNPYPIRARRRSIPAHAGEPTEIEIFNADLRVYPRPRGGTDYSCDRKQGGAGLSPPTRGNPLSNAFRRNPKGLSPPTRGNPPARGLYGGLPRSIPAHAGEPGLDQPPEPARRVYPRPRGGTRLGRRARTTAQGLSPPTRGNHSNTLNRDTRTRSIPAHAGEPSLRTGAGRERAVYPRPRGGT